MPATVGYDERLADAICDAIATQPKSLAAVLEDLGKPINPSTWYRWLQSNADLRNRYARARSEQAQVMADEIAALADTEPEKVEIPTKAGSYEAIDRGHLEWMRQRIDSRKWLASKLLPKTYGDKVQAEVTGKDGEPIQAAISVQFVASKPADVPADVPKQG